MLGELCEVCLCTLTEEDLEDSVTLSADCCGRVGLCSNCREHGEHDCDEGIEHERWMKDHPEQAAIEKGGERCSRSGW